MLCGGVVQKWQLGRAVRVLVLRRGRRVYTGLDEGLAKPATARGGVGVVNWKQPLQGRPDEVPTRGTARERGGDWCAERSCRMGAG